MLTSAFIEGQIYRAIDEDSGNPKPYDSETPEYDCYESAMTGDFFLGDCWVVDSKGNRHPGYSEDAVPVRRGCLQRIEDRADIAQLLKDLFEEAATFPTSSQDDHVDIPRSR